MKRQGYQIPMGIGGECFFCGEQEPYYSAFQRHHEVPQSLAKVWDLLPSEEIEHVFLICPNCHNYLTFWCFAVFVKNPRVKERILSRQSKEERTVEFLFEWSKFLYSLIKFAEITP